MIRAKEFNTLLLQFSIFTPGLHFSTNKVLGSLVSKFADTFNGNTTALPLPQDAPIEIPRIILPSADGRLKLDIAISRANFFRYLGQEEAVIDDSSFFKICLEVFKEYITCTNAKVGRLAIVAVKFIKEENPGLALAKHFCKDEWIEQPFNHPEGFEIHSHKKYVLNDFKINSWVRCKSGFLKKDNVKIILVEQDINTLSEEIEQNDFNIVQIKKFSNIVVKEQKSILNRYFPNND